MFKKWNYVPCTTPSESRIKVSEFIKIGKGTKFELCVIGNGFGFRWK